MTRRNGLLAALALLAAPAAARAEEAPICTDRPTKANATCTVPAGKWQLESNAAGWSRTEAGGANVTLRTLGSSVVKLGLSDRSDVQIGVTPYVHAEARLAGVKSQRSSFGDVTVRLKYRLTGDGSKIQLALIPFAKLPTAKSGIGNGKAEGGIAVPISMPAGAATLTLGPELDLLADADGPGRHLQLVNLVNLAVPVAPRLTAVGELWTATNFDPADTVTQASAEAALAYAITNRVQLDAGANAGLNRHTPDIEAYAGLSIRF